MELKPNKMTLKDLELKPSYDSDEDKILASFYIPVLAQSIKYHRLAGFFSSSALAIAARGLAAFIRNTGHMKLIVGVKLKKRDVDAIRQGIENPESIIQSVLVNELNLIEDEFIRDHVRGLAWMIAKKKLEIKIAVLTDKNGSPLSEDDAEKRGIFHLKVGILEDTEGNMVSFSGSVNESAWGWKENIEEFKVFRSWVDGEINYLKSDVSKFNKYWYSQAEQVKIYDLPKAVEEHLIKIAPDDFEELKYINIKPKTEIRLRPIQTEAVRSWYNNNKNGIFEMATGTGKTYAALACIKELEKELKNFGVVIVCPFQHLIRSPWLRDIKRFDFEKTPIRTAYGDTNSWINNVTDAILSLNSRIFDKLIILTTYDTFSSTKFIDALNKAKVPILLIADEVHNAGSPMQRCGLINKYDYRLGLSATPSRWFDEEGTKVIYEFFNKTVFEFSMRDAIEKINPDTGETYLAPYEYYPHFVEMTPEEFYEYEQISKKIAVKYYQTKNDKDQQKYYDLLLFERSRIIKNAKNKMSEFEKIIDSTKSIKHALAYCSDTDSIEAVQKILNKKCIINHRFTQSESDDEREDLLKKFDADKYQVLVAIKCLDEGIDVPSTRTAIILASTTNPREYIQRRGRVLRRFPGKDKAIIHDFIVTPPESILNERIRSDIFNLERKILEKEFKRFKEFADLALNRLQALNMGIPVLNKYKIKLETQV